MANVTSPRNCILSYRSGKTALNSRGMMPPQKNINPDSTASPTHLYQALPLSPLVRKEDNTAPIMAKRKSNIERRRSTGMSPVMAMKEGTMMAPFKALTNIGILSTGSSLWMSITLTETIKTSQTNQQKRSLRVKSITRTMQYNLPIPSNRLNNNQKTAGKIHSCEIRSKTQQQTQSFVSIRSKPEIMAAIYRKKAHFLNPQNKNMKRLNLTKEES